MVEDKDINFRGIHYKTFYYRILQAATVSHFHPSLTFSNKVETLL